MTTILKKFNSWFKEQRESIIRDEGKDKYNKYTRSLFKTYLTATNEEFLDTMKDEKRKWTQGKCPANYSHREVMKVATKAYNNIKSAKEWNIATVAKKEDDAKHRAMNLAKAKGRHLQ